MRKKSYKGRARAPWLRALALAFVLVGVGLTLYGWFLSTQIEKRFSGRRWSIPSRVFSDSALLYPGQPMGLSALREKLHRLGYREVSGEPRRKGDLRATPHALDLYLHDLVVPSRRREGFRVKILFDREGIRSIVRPVRNDPVPILEIEPEEVMLLFGAERERRELVSIDRVPAHLIHAVLAAEDSRFYRHKGLDLRGIIRALYADLRQGAFVQGGSTITQQLAKNYFLSPEKTFSRKVKELFLSLIVEAMYDKDDILEIYLNEIYLGQNGSVSVNGVGEASRFYFGRPVAELSVAEAAALAGLIRGPNAYSPFVDKERALKRRDSVLRTMRRNGWISQEALRSSLASPLKTVGPKPYARNAPYFVDYLTSQLETLYPREALSSLGLSIYTTLDVEVQKAAEKALARGLARLEKSNPSLIRSEPERKLQGAVVVMHPKTGYILAMVGGRNHAVSQFNRITQARRQPGSAFKPFVYLCALDRFTPASLLPNKPKSYEIEGKVWQPRNDEPMTEGPLRMREALARSVNLVAVDLAMQTGLDRVVKTAEAFGFSTPLHPYPSLSLGASEVIPLELARAYCAFAADGVLPYPLSLKEVVDEQGRTLERKHMSIQRVTSPEKAFIMSSMLRSVVTEGTGKSLAKYGITFPVAAKTGTTNGFKDAWFVGYTPDILALVWVGFDDGTPIQASGSKAALPIWADLLNAIPQYVSGGWLEMPPNVVKETVCSLSGKRAVNGCPNPIEEVFLRESVPTEYCRLHQPTNSIQRFIEGIKGLFKGS
jgi:penicillin-binding protein 1B